MKSRDQQSLYESPFYVGGTPEDRVARRAAILTYVPHTAKIYGTTTPAGKYEPRMGLCRICQLPGADHPNMGEQNDYHD